MQLSFSSYKFNEPIPVNDFIRNRKMTKYYNRESQAALVTIGKLLKDRKIDPLIPIFYATGVVEHEEFDLNKIASNSVDESGLFSNKMLMEKGMLQISPLTQFKVLYNMTLCFISIEHGLKGENAAIYASAAGLLANAMFCNSDEEIIIGAGKVYSDGLVESGFAIVTKSELEELPQFDSDTEAIEVFKYLVGST